MENEKPHVHQCCSCFAYFMCGSDECSDDGSLCVWCERDSLRIEVGMLNARLEEYENAQNNEDIGKEMDRS